MKNNLKKILDTNKLSVTKLSQETGISRTTLRPIYYQEAFNVELNTLQKLCDYLHCKLSELIDYVPS